MWGWVCYVGMGLLCGDGFAMWDVVCITGNLHLNQSDFFKRVPVNENERLLVQMKAHDACKWIM